MKTKLFHLTVLWIVTATLPPCFAQDLPYSSGSTGADGAFTVNVINGFGVRLSHTMGYDAGRQEMVVYGGGYYNGYPNSSTINLVDRSDTQVLANGSWSQKSASGPTQRRYCGMSYDSQYNKLFLFGGLLSTSNVYNNLYEWTGSGWTTVSASPTPTQRYGHAMAYDPVNQESVTFGGWTGSAALSETRTFDGVSTWTVKSPVNKPSARYHTKMVWDAARQEIVLFGGYEPATTSAKNDTWVWDGSDWTEETPATTTPPPRYDFAMGYDGVNNRVVIFGGYRNDTQEYLNDTWVWNGTDWTEIPTTQALTPRSAVEMAWDSTAKELYLTGGRDQGYLDRQDTWVWDNTKNDWVQIGGPLYMVDMNAKPNGVWNYTTINVPTGITVDFVPNAANSAVTWLASDDVIIDGVVSLDGKHGALRDNIPVHAAPGGPAGFAGGLGGNRVELYNSVAGTPGSGPGGGAPGINPNNIGDDGQHNGVYGNPYIVPLKGGSGGGGGAVYLSTTKGGNGGGGAGAMLIASSRDVTINGVIRANGGYYGRNISHSASTSSGRGGHGSGGAVKVVCDRLLGNGRIETKGGNGQYSSTSIGGYVRLESYLRPFDISGQVYTATRSNSAPVQSVDYGSPAALVITSVDGESVANPPSGSFANPDVVFSDSGDVTIIVTATNVPDGTPVTLKIVHSAGTINLPAGGDPDVTLSGGTATFTATVPEGFGTIQAFAEYDITPAP